MPTKLAGVVAIALALSGCLTSMVISSLEEFENENVEFLGTETAEFYGPVQGVYCGTVLSEGRTYERYLFDGILAGRGERALQVLVPVGDHDNWTEAIVSECEMDGESLAPAGLLYCWDINFGWWKDCSRSRRDPGAFHNIIAEYGLDRHVTDSYGAHLLFINFANPRPTIVFISPATENRDPEWDCRFVLLDLDWGVRSRTKYCLLHAALVATVPLDIVLAPLQLLGVLIYIAKGG